MILAAVMRQSAHLKTYQLGPHSALTQKLLNEVSAAKVCLLDPQRKAAYNARLRKELEAKETSSRVKALPAAKPLPDPSPATTTLAEPAGPSGIGRLVHRDRARFEPSHRKAKKAPLVLWERGGG